MNINLKYVPIFRGRQQEFYVLKSFDFGENIYPCLEIIKELDRMPPKQKGMGSSIKRREDKTFEKVYLPLIREIKSEKVFVDLPIHLKESRKMKLPTFSFLRTVVGDRLKRTEYIKKLEPLASKVIPVISTYFGRSSERGSILLQEKDLRPHFKSLAFRTFPDGFISRDLEQIKKVITIDDYLIMDWGETELDITDEDQIEIVEQLRRLLCTVIIHRNSISNELTNVGLEHNEKVDCIDNGLLEKYKDFGGDCFSDYAGIKKDEVNDGGTVSPGFIYYDAVRNEFYGFKGIYQRPETYETIMIPDIVNSAPTQRMKKSKLDYLGLRNVGWKILDRIHNRQEPGQSAAKFKRIGMEHYLHCLREKIMEGFFN